MIVGRPRALLALLGAPLAAAGIWASVPATAASTHAAPVRIYNVQEPVHGNQSANWSGYNQGLLEKGKLFTAVTGLFQVPHATQRNAGAQEYSSTWVGVGGGCVTANCSVGDDTLIQAGTEQDVAPNGAASYYAWFELIPAPSIRIPLTVRPYDWVSVRIVQKVPGLWSIRVANKDTGQIWQTLVPYASTMDTAEWIEETPLIIGTNAGFSSMPNLTPVHFDLATVNGKNPDLVPGESVQLVPSTTVVATPSAPDGDRDGFNDCTYATSCASFGS
jgi:hypothetical protein